MGAVAKPCNRRLLLLAVAVLVVLVGSCCCADAEAAAAADYEQEQLSSKSKAGGSRRRRRSRRRAVAADAVTPAAPLMVPITILKSAVDSGAVCMDGTPPAYHLHPGSGAGNNSWIVNLEGGGWCNNVRACQFRKASRRGSSDLMEKEIPFGGIMSSSPVDNPDFYNWNRVKIRYCDGASFAGEGFDKENEFYFRGQRIWDATVRHLLSIGMASADQVLLTGCSAGGLAVILHCDQFQAFFPRSSNAGAGTTTVKCLADAGLFLDASDVSGGRSLRSYYSDVVAMQGVGPNLPPACTARLDTTSCFFPQNVIDGISTPIFLLNAAYDAWQIQESLAPSGADPSGAWRACKSNHSACDASQMKFLQDFRDQMVASVNDGSRSNGLFINSCFAHCQSELPATWSDAAGGAAPAIQSRVRPRSLPVDLDRSIDRSRGTEMTDRPSLPALIALAVLVGSYCCVASSAASPAVEDELRGAGGRTMRRRAASVMVPITILKSAVSDGAVCMDGTPPAYNLDPGSGAGSRSWIVNLEGGAWCNSAKTCQLTKSSGRGSSDHMDKEIPFTGIMSSSPAVNPDFYNWNRVKIRYCDGGSFAGEAFDKDTGIYFRGQRIWNEVIRHLLSIGMASADQVLLTGCSSGGLAVILHCDQLRAFFPSGTTVVKCISDGGLYLDAVDVSGGRSLRSYFGDIVAMQGIAQNLPPACTARLDATSCFFPQNIIDDIKTPLFLLNAAYDFIQIVLSLAPDRADPSGAWRACKSNRTACSASQMSFLQDFRDQMVASVNKGFSGSRSNGLFISSCFAHCQSEQLGTWNTKPGGSPTIQNKGIAKSVGDWYFDRAEVKAIDCRYPCDNTCHHII